MKPRRPGNAQSRGGMRAPLAAMALGALVPLLAGGCSALQMTLLQPRVHECESGFDVPLSSLVGTSRKELRVKVVGRKLDQDIPFVVESGPESFVIVAFTPLGTKAFTLERRGDAKPVVASMIGPVLPVPPRNIMSDVLAMSWPSGCLGTAEGVAVSAAGEWEVTDTCEDSRAIARRIGRPGKPAEVEVSYPGDSIVVTQKTCRYTARYVFQGAAGPPAPEATDEGAEQEAAEAAAAARRTKPFPVPGSKAAAKARKPVTKKPAPAGGAAPASAPARDAAPSPAPSAAPARDAPPARDAAPSAQPATAPPPVSAGSPRSVPAR